MSDSTVEAEQVVATGRGIRHTQSRIDCMEGTSTVTEKKVNAYK